jgi:hypothetical protein
MSVIANACALGSFTVPSSPLSSLAYFKSRRDDWNNHVPDMNVGVAVCFLS